MVATYTTDNKLSKNQHKLRYWNGKDSPFYLLAVIVCPSIFIFTSNILPADNKLITRSTNNNVNNIPTMKLLSDFTGSAKKYV